MKRLRVSLIALVVVAAAAGAAWKPATTHASDIWSWDEASTLSSPAPSAENDSLNYVLPAN
jgi:hypothetical protein